MFRIGQENIMRNNRMKMSQEKWRVYMRKSFLCGLLVCSSFPEEELEAHCLNNLILDWINHSKIYCWEQSCKDLLQVTTGMCCRSAMQRHFSRFLLAKQVEGFDL